MCDRPGCAGLPAWRGWQTLPPRRAMAPTADWVDLTHPFSPTVPHTPLVDPPEVGRIRSMPGEPMNVTRIASVVHVGTHLDAPSHFVPDGPCMEAVPLERCMGPGVVLSMDVGAYGTIDAADLEAARPAIEPGDIVAIDTGWERRWGTPDWGRNPSLTDRAAAWLVEKNLRLLATDTPTPELPLDRRGSDFAFGVHRTMLAHGVLIAEQLANLGRLAGQRVEFMMVPIPIVASDGAPVRALARPVSA